MASLVLPRAYSIATGNRALCARIGIRFNGRDMGNSVAAYDSVEGWIRLDSGEVRHGRVEPYWRTVAKRTA